MMRRLLATLSVTVLAFTLALRAADPVPPGGSKAPELTPAQIEALQKEAAFKQAQMKKEFEEFRTALLTLAQRLEASPNQDHKDKARLLREAIDFANKQGVETKFQAMIGMLKKDAAFGNINIIDQLKEKNDDLRADILALIKLLQSDDPDSRLREERLRLERMLERLKEVIAKQERVRAQTEIGRKDPEALKREQEKVTAETKGLIGGKEAGKEGKQATKAEGKPGEVKQDGQAQGKDDTQGNKGEQKNPNAAEQKNPGEATSKEGPKGESQGGEAKQGMPPGMGEQKPAEGKQGEQPGMGQQGMGEQKPSEGKQGGEGKEGAQGQGKEGAQQGMGEQKPGENKQGAQQGMGQGEQKPSEGKQGGEGKEGAQGQGKQSQGMGQQGKEGENKQGGQQGMGMGKPSEGKQAGQQGQGKEGGQPGKQGENKPSGGQGEAKEGGKPGMGMGMGMGQAGQGKPSEGGMGMGGMGMGKPSEGKPGQGGMGQPGKPAEGKEGGMGMGQQSGENKPSGGQPMGMGQQGGEKKEQPPQQPGQQPQKPAESKGKEEGKSENKPGTEKQPGGMNPMNPMQGGQKPSESKPGQGGQGKPSQGKGEGEEGGGGGGKSKPGQPKETPEEAEARKRVEDSNKYQKSAENKIEKKDNQGAGNDQDEAIKQLEIAKKELEKLLKQKRQEEIERLLGKLQARCEFMLGLQKRVRDETVKVNDETKDQKLTDAQEREKAQKANDLMMKEEEIVKEANMAIRLIEAEGSAIAFAEVFKQVRGDMINVQNRFRRTDVGDITIAIENDIISTLEEMIEALKKARQDNQEKPKESKPGEPQSQKPQDQKLLDAIAELKLIRSMQKRVNDRTELYAKKYSGEQAPVPSEAKDPKAKEEAEAILGEMKELSTSQQKIGKITRDIALGRNKAN